MPGDPPGDRTRAGSSGEDEEQREDPESIAAARERKARLEAAKRRYRATLRNEADAGEGGFSKDFYSSQKPPHWG